MPIYAPLILCYLYFSYFLSILWELRDRQLDSGRSDIIETRTYTSHVIVAVIELKSVEEITCSLYQLYMDNQYLEFGQLKWWAAVTPPGTRVAGWIVAGRVLGKIVSESDETG
eukprot:gene24299-biopygen9952